jgi:hypothetical protein
MPIKHPRDETEIRQLAEDLAARWQRADGVEPWLRSLEPELSGKVRHHRWSWESLARTLNVAGITYATNRPRTGRSLLRKIATVRFEGRLARKSRASLPAAAQPQVPPGNSTQPTTTPILSSSPPPPTDSQSATEDEAPEFRPATLRGWSGTKIVRGEKKPAEVKAPDAPTPANDAADVIARLLGRK